MIILAGAVGVVVGSFLPSPIIPLSIVPQQSKEATTEPKQSQPVFRDMRWGDPIMTSPRVQYVETVDNTEWYVIQDDDDMYEGVYVDTYIQPLSYGYQNNKLVAIAFRTFSGGSERIINVLAEKHGPPKVYFVKHWDDRVYGTPSDLFYFESQDVIYTVFVSDPWHRRLVSGSDVILMAPSYWKDYQQAYYGINDNTRVLSLLEFDDPEEESRVRSNRTYHEDLARIGRYPYIYSVNFLDKSDCPFLYWNKDFRFSPR
ncbi:MAG: hypothetical protein ACOYD6_06040 [Limnochordia bacterium]